MRHTGRGSAVIEKLRAFLSMRMHTAQPGFEEADITHVVSCVSIIIKGQLVIENMLQRDIIRGGMETEGGMPVARDESLPRVVVGSKQAKVIITAGKISWENRASQRKSKSMLFLKSYLA